MAVTAVLFSLAQCIQRKKLDGQTLITLWVLLLFFYQGIQFAKPMRYFYPIYPMLAVSAGLFAGRFIGRIVSRSEILLRRSLLVGLVGLLLWPFAFVSIYLQPNTRIAASQWIYNNIPKGATIAVEHWDDPLPLCLPAQAGLSDQACNQYTIVTLPVFDADTPEKWQHMDTILAKTDYLILSSNRGYGAIGRAKDRFPQTDAYYRKLFSNESEFALVAQFTSRPIIPIPFLRICLPVTGFSYGINADIVRDCPHHGVSVIDDYADETFTVYDHPKVLIFQKQNNP